MCIPACLNVVRLAALACVTLLPALADAQKAAPVEYKVLATNKTSTMQKELAEAGDQGFAFVGLTVAKTLMGGDEEVSILRRSRQ